MERIFEIDDESSLLHPSAEQRTLYWTLDLVDWVWCFIITVYNIKLWQRTEKSWSWSFQMPINFTILSLIVLRCLSRT